MSASRKAVAPATPQFVQHAKRPTWGVGRVTDVFAGLVRVQFSDGVSREFREDVLQAVATADVPPEMLAATPATPSAPTPPKRVRKARAK